MAAPLSQDLRRRLVQAIEAGSSARQAAARFAVSRTAVHRLMRRVRVAWLEQAGRDASQSRALLVTMTETLRLMAEHLAVEEEEVRQLGQPATITAWPWANLP